MHLYVFDGYSVLYRAYHAVPSHLRAPQRDGRDASLSGVRTNAVYGFVKTFVAVTKEHRESHGEDSPVRAIVAWDRPSTASGNGGNGGGHDLPLLRELLWPQYKECRRSGAVSSTQRGAATPKGRGGGSPESAVREMRAQYPHLQRILSAMGVRQARAPVGYEADDLISSIAARAARLRSVEGITVVTGDDDHLQMVDGKVEVLRFRGGGAGQQGAPWRVYGPEEVSARYGIPAYLLPDHKALMGDSGDGYPGVRGVGEATASALLRRYGSLSGIYERIDEVTPDGLRERLVSGREDAFRCLRLARLYTHAPLPSWLSRSLSGENGGTLEELAFDVAGKGALSAYERYGFASVASSLRNEHAQPTLGLFSGKGSFPVSA